MKENRKNYKFNDEIIRKFEALQSESGKTQTSLVEDAIQYIYGEYQRALKGMEHDELLLSQVLGKDIEKAV